MFTSSKVRQPAVSISVLLIICCVDSMNTPKAKRLLREEEVHGKWFIGSRFRHSKMLVNVKYFSNPGMGIGGEK